MCVQERICIEFFLLRISFKFKMNSQRNLNDLNAQFDLLDDLIGNTIKQTELANDLNIKIRL